MATGPEFEKVSTASDTRREAEPFTIKPLSARSEALAALRRCADGLWMASRFRATCDRDLEALLDAIPASVLARLAVERGGLERVNPVELLGEDPLASYVFGDTSVSACGPIVVNKAPPVPVYRITEEGPT